MSKYKIENPNRQFNDWDAVEEQIANLDKKIDQAVLGEQSFANIQGDPTDNTALAEALDEKADVGDSYTKAEDDSLLELKADKSTTYTKTEVDELLEDKADVGDSYTKAEDDALLDGKVDKETGKELMPSTLPDRVAQNETDIQDLKDDKQDKMQFTEMPSPYTYLGKIVQYVGPTNTQYTNGLFYQGDYDSASLQYIWQPIGTSKGPEYTAGQGIEITDNEIKCTLINDTLTSTTTTWSSQKLRHEFEAIAGATKVFVVAELPQVGELNSIYYQGTEAPYNIYLYTSNNEWVFIGTTGVNLQNYYTKTEVDNLINTYKPASGAGTIVAGSQQGMRVNILCDNPLSIDNANQHLKLNYNEGLDVNSNNELKVNYGDGLKLNGSNNKIEVNTDGNSVRINSDGELYIPLKNVAGEDLIGTGNISFKTINGNNIKGSGNIQIDFDVDLIYDGRGETAVSGTTITVPNYNKYNLFIFKWVTAGGAEYGRTLITKYDTNANWFINSSDFLGVKYINNINYATGQMTMRGFRQLNANTSTTLTDSQIHFQCLGIKSI